MVEQAGTWWQDAALVRRFVCDLVAGELALQRRAAARLPPLPWDDALDLRADLGVDSLELLALATALAQALQLQHSGVEDYLLARVTVGDWVALAQAGQRQFAAELVFRTSGSAGQPKPCMHRLDTLLQEVRELAPLLPGRRRILCAVPSHHIYGFLFSLLLPRALGLDAGAFVDLRASSPARLAGLLREGDLVVAHPEYWRAALEVTPAFPAGVAGVSSTAPCPDELARALSGRGLGQLLQVYGSSETGGVGWRNRAGAPFTRFSYWRRDGDDALLRALPGGAVRYPCQDRLEWSGDDHFLPAGRLDQAVQVGGTNVFPAAVARTLCTHPEVQQASARLMREDEGRRIKAFIVPRADVSDLAGLAARLDLWARSVFSNAERPAAFSFGARLPRTAGGKPADWIIDPDTAAAPGPR